MSQAGAIDSDVIRNAPYRIAFLDGINEPFGTGVLAPSISGFLHRPQRRVSLLERDRDEEIHPDGEAAVLPEFVDFQKRLHVYPITIGNL